MTYTAVQAAKDVLTGRVQYADKAVQEQRLGVCRQCPSYKPTISTCGECGCYLPAKVKFQASICPKNHW